MAGLASRIHQGSVPIGFRRAAVCFSACSLLILRAQKARQERDHSYCCEFDHTASLVLDLVRKPLFQARWRYRIVTAILLRAIWRNDNAMRSVETVNRESIPIAVGREEDGRWWADIESMPGVMAYGPTREAAIAAVRALALRVAADCIDHGEAVPRPFAKTGRH